MTDVAPPTCPGWYADAGGAWWWWDGARWTTPAAGPAGFFVDRSAERNQARLVWAIGLLTWIGPLVFYLTAKDKPFVRHHAAEALNTAILSMMITLPLSLVAGPLAAFYVISSGEGDEPSSGLVITLVVVGLVAAVVSVAVLVVNLLGLLGAHRGEWWRSPAPIHWVKGSAARGEEPYSVV